MVSPGRISKVTSCRRVPASSNPKPACSKRKAPLTVSGTVAWSGEVMVFSVSITSKWRSSAVLAVSAMASSMPENSTGVATTAAVAKNATSAPMLSCPLATSMMPTTSPTPSASSGSKVTTSVNPACCLALAISV
ncbi:hypothetical protein D3C73_1094950 [compost metagenome]